MVQNEVLKVQSRGVKALCCKPIQYNLVMYSRAASAHKVVKELFSCANDSVRKELIDCSISHCG